MYLCNVVSSWSESVQLSVALSVAVTDSLHAQLEQGGDWQSGTRHSQSAGMWKRLGQSACDVKCPMNT